MFLRGRKLNILLVFISQSYLKVPETIRQNSTHFIMNIPNKRKLQQIASKLSSDTDFKDFMKFYKECTKEPYSSLVNDTTLPSVRTYYKMIISEKIKALKTKSSKTKLNTIWIKKLLRFLLYHQEMLVNMNF